MPRLKKFAGGTPVELSAIGLAGEGKVSGLEAASARRIDDDPVTTAWAVGR